MEKDFDRWNLKKKDIQAQKTNVFYHAREIWWCSLGVNIGSEQDGSGEEYYRPVLVLKGFSKQTCLVVPLTASIQNHPLRPSIGVVEDKKAHALISQMRVIDTKRLVRKMGYLDKDMFEKIQKTVKEIL